MNFKHILATLTLGLCLCPMSLSAIDFEWRVSLNNRYHADPYGYRYSLADRFRIQESRVIWVMDNVREPADAYLVFRLSELSGKPYDYVVTVYRQNRYSSWYEIASLIGVSMNTYEFDELRRHHDLRHDSAYDSRRYNRYEDRRVIIKREEIYVPRVYEEQRYRHQEPEPRHHNGYHERRDEQRNLPYDEHRRYEDERRR